MREGDGVVDAELARRARGRLLGGLTALVEVAGVLLVVALGTWAIEDGRLSVGGLLAFLAYVTQLLRPVSDLGHLASSCWPRRRVGNECSSCSTAAPT